MNSYLVNFDGSEFIVKASHFAKDNTHLYFYNKYTVIRCYNLNKLKSVVQINEKENSSALITLLESAIAKLKASN